MLVVAPGYLILVRLLIFVTRNRRNKRRLAKDEVTMHLGSGSKVDFITVGVLIGNDIEFLDSIKGYLNNKYSMKDLDEAAYILDFHNAHTLIKF